MGDAARCRWVLSGGALRVTRVGRSPVTSLAVARARLFLVSYAALGGMFAAADRWWPQELSSQYSDS
jgi:hypothetical protein